LTLETTAPLSVSAVNRKGVVGVALFRGKRHRGIPSPGKGFSTLLLFYLALW
tara:strand:+ start:7966 stop:8121 length:156 start_codon:yes stop_codon:yes gene_type:complete